MTPSPASAPVPPQPTPPPGAGPAAPEAQAPILGRIAALLAPYKGQLILVALAVLVSAGLSSVSPFLTRAVFDRALFPVDGSGADVTLLAWLVGAMILIPVITALIGILQNFLTARVGNLAMADLRTNLFSHLQKMELAFFTTTKTGAIQSRLANDVSGVRTVLTDTATTILQNTVTVAAAFIAMVLLSWQLTILTLIVMPIFILIQVRVGRRRQRLARRTQESLSEMTAITEESLSVSGILLAKVFNRASGETERYRLENQKQAKLQLEAAMTGRTFFAMVQTFFAITPALLYLAAGFLITGDIQVGGAALTAGTLVAFTTLQARLQQPLMQLMRVTLDVQTSLALFRRLFEYLDLVPAISERPGARELDMSAGGGRIEFDHVFFRYPEPRELSDTRTRGRGTPDEVDAGAAEIAATAAAAVDASGARNVAVRAGAVDAAGGDAARRAGDDDDSGPGDDLGPTWTLADLSFTVEPGTLAAFVGPSGSGKTTATYLVPRFYDVTEGSVRIDGLDVRDATEDSLANAVGMVTQEPYLFHGTIGDNIAYARPSATREEVEQAARDANIHDRIMSFEEGYDTITGERGFRLSGGEKQRLAIARVFLMNPRILILDEATSALDTETERLVQEALERATSGRTTIAIAHRLSTIQNADVIFGLEDGELVEQGTHTELLARGGLYSRLYHEQFGGGEVEARFDDGVRFADGTTRCERKPRIRPDVSV